MRIGNSPRLLRVTWQPESFDIKCSSKADLLMHITCCKISPIYWQSADNVTFGLYTGDDIVFAGYIPQWALLQELRVFNANSEMHIWKYGKSYFGRWIKNETEASDKHGNCLEQTVKLWGTRAEPVDRFVMLRENRGMKLTLPIEWESRFTDGINAFLRERLYIKEDEIGCAYIVDRRFCGILIADERGELNEIIDFTKHFTKTAVSE